MNTKSNKAAILFDELISNGFKPDTAKFIISQAAHETGNFHSQLFTDFNNPFGMKQAGDTRKNASKGTFYGYATYEDIFHAAKDFRYYWQAKKLKETYKDVTDYVTTLKSKGYFEAPLQVYLMAVEHFYNFYYK